MSNKKNDDIDKLFLDNISSKYIVVNEVYRAMEEDLTCPICQDIYVEPYICLSCQVAVCKKCLDDWWKKSELKCPFRCKNAKFSFDKNKSKVLEKLNYKCIKGCEKIIQKQNLKEHLEKCSGEPFLSRVKTIEITEARKAGLNFPTAKIIMLGSMNVGKTSILNTFINQSPMIENRNTVGFDFSFVNYRLSDGSMMNFQIMDTSGTERFRSITSVYIRNVSGCLLVYDITNKCSFPARDTYYLEKLHEHYGDDMPPIILVGNKNDLEEKRQVSIDEGVHYAKENKFYFKETSAKTNNNITNIFEVMFELVNFERKKKKEIAEDDDYQIIELEDVIIDDEEFRQKKKKCCKSK